FGRVSRAGVVPLAWSFDHVGPLARDVAGLAAAFDAIAGPDPRDPVCSMQPPARCSDALTRGIDGLRIAVAGGHFAQLAVAEALREVDVLLAPTTPWPAPAIGAPWTTRIGGTEVLTRSHLGVYTQPLSFIGLPVISVPVVALCALPLGVQLIAAPFNEAALFRVAARLEGEGVVRVPAHSS